MSRLKRVREEFLDEYDERDELREKIKELNDGIVSLDRVQWIVTIIVVAFIAFDFATIAQGIAGGAVVLILVAVTRCENRATYAVLLARGDTADLRRDLAHARAQLFEIESRLYGNNTTRLE